MYVSLNVFSLFFNSFISNIWVIFLEYIQESVHVDWITYSNNRGL